jgi:hypothetical protein
VAFQDLLGCAGGGVPQPHRPVGAGGGQQLPIADLHRAHPDHGGGVAVQDGAFGAALCVRPESAVGRGRGGVVVADGGCGVVEGFGDGEQGEPLGWVGGDGPGGAAQQGRGTRSGRGVGVVGGGDQPPQIRVQNIVEVGEQGVDQAGAGGVAGQRAPAEMPPTRTSWKAMVWCLGLRYDDRAS